MIVIRPDAFKGVAPPVELFDYPLFFPKPFFRGRPPPVDDDDPEVMAAKEKKRREKAEKKAREKIREPPSEVMLKFSKISGGNPAIDADKAGQLARSLGFAPSQQDLADLDARDKGLVTLNSFEGWREDKIAPYKQSDNPSDLKVFFEQFDTTGAGTLTRQQMQTILGAYGEAMTEEEIDGILNDFGLTGNAIDYSEFVDLLLKA